MSNNKETLANGNDEETQLIEGHAFIMDQLHSYANSLALRCAVELRLADIIHSHGSPMTLSHIGSKIESSSSLDLSYLARVMQFLVRRNIFSVTYTDSSDNDNEVSEPFYGLTPGSKWLIRDNEYSVVPMILTFTDPSMIAPWYKISQSIKEGGRPPFDIVYGESLWDKASKEPEFNNLFNSGMASITRPMLKAILTGYKDGFSELKGTIVDVGGGMGKVVATIVETYPHINGINFDMPHVIASAPQYPGVTHVAGDMFKEIPDADAVFLKSIILDWDDEDCIKILKNCQKAVSARNGKVIIADTIVYPNGKGVYDDSKFALDLLIMAVCVRGKARTEDEWKKLLKQAGFSNYNIISIPTTNSIIEAFP